MMRRPLTSTAYYSTGGLYARDWVAMECLGARDFQDSDRALLAGGPLDAPLLIPAGYADSTSAAVAAQAVVKRG